MNAEKEERKRDKHIWQRERKQGRNEMRKGNLKRWRGEQKQEDREKGK